MKKDFLYNEYNITINNVYYNIFFTFNDETKMNFKLQKWLN